MTFETLTKILSPELKELDQAYSMNKWVERGGKHSELFVCDVSLCDVVCVSHVAVWRTAQLPWCEQSNGCNLTRGSGQPKLLAHNRVDINTRSTYEIYVKYCMLYTEGNLNKQTRFTCNHKCL